MRMGIRVEALVHLIRFSGSSYNAGMLHVRPQRSKVFTTLWLENTTKCALGVVRVSR